MGGFHSVILRSQKREDMSCCDSEHQHGKTWNTLASTDDHLSLTSVFRVCLFMGVSCKNMQNDEEQNPVAVRLPKNCLFLLKQLKNWIANNFSGFNAAKIISSIYQEPIYRSPGGGQQTVNARYRIFLQIENHDAFYQGANRSQMLPWDAHEPPPKRVTHGGSWYIVSMEVFKDEMDIGGQSPDNPEVHLKVILHIANRRMTWTPPDFSPFDIRCQTETYRYTDALNPFVLNYHVDYTLSPEELCQLVRIQKYLSNEQPKDPIPKDIKTLLPELLEFNYSAIHLDCRNLNISINPNTVLQTHYKSEDTRTLAPGPPEFNHDAIHLGYRNLNISSNPNTVLHSSCYKSDLNSVPSTVIPNQNWPNYEAIHEDHQDVNADGNSKKCPLSTNIKAGNSAAPGLKAICILLLLAPSAAAFPVSQDHLAEFEILRDSDNHFSCTLKIDNEYALCDDCKQNEKQHKTIFDATGKKLMRDFCEQQKNAMETNLYSLMKNHDHKSGSLKLNLILKLDKGFNVTNVTNVSIQYIFNGKKLTDEEATNLPMTITDFPNSDPNSPLYMEKMKVYVNEVWKRFREKLLPFPKIDDQPENTNSSVNAKANTTNRWIIAIATVFVVGFIMAIAIVPNIKCSGKKICKKLHESCLNYRRAAQNEDEAEGDPNVMETRKREDPVTDSV